RQRVGPPGPQFGRFSKRDDSLGEILFGLREWPPPSFGFPIDAMQVSLAIPERRLQWPIAGRGSRGASQRVTRRAPLSLSNRRKRRAVICNDTIGQSLGSLSQ